MKRSHVRRACKSLRATLFTSLFVLFVMLAPGAAQLCDTVFTVSNTVLGSDPPNTTRVRLQYDYPPVAGSEQGITEDYFLIAPVDTDAEPVQPLKAVVVLFVGGSGVLGLGDDQVGLRSANFLFRQRWAFAAAGPFAVAVPDASSFFIDGAGSLAGQRISNRHLVDIASVINDLRSRFPGLPVWVVGTSRGTISAMAAAAKLDACKPDGLVSTSTLTNDPDPDQDVFDVPLHLINVPTLIVTHQGDTCVRTPPSETGLLIAALTGAPKVRVRKFVGGYRPISDGCDSLSPHGYFGIERWVVESVTGFIHQNSP